MNDGTGLTEVLSGLPGFRVLDVNETKCEVVIRIETAAAQAFCRTCGVRAEPQDRIRVDAGIGWSFADHDLGGDELLAAALCSGTRNSEPSAGAQTGDELTT